MEIKIPQGKGFSWTKHSIKKMRFYGLSANKVKRILRRPERIEEGIATGTIAVMQRSTSKKRRHEIWAMYAPFKGPKRGGKSLIIISAWRYPGESSPGREIPIPEELRPEIEKEIENLKKN
ncbi:MAG: hypothetical protein V1841_02065 [Patescibacteria group bacterium]